MTYDPADFWPPEPQDRARDTFDDIWDPGYVRPHRDLDDHEAQADFAVSSWLGAIENYANGNNVNDEVQTVTAELFDHTPLTSLLLTLSKRALASRESLGHPRDARGHDA